MKRFSASYETASVLEFLINTIAISNQGGVATNFPAPGDGVPVKGTVHLRQVHEAEPDGSERFVTRGTVSLLDDPSALNGGLGVQLDDGFRWNGLVMQAQSDAKPIVVAGAIACWKIDVLLVA